MSDMHNNQYPVTASTLTAGALPSLEKIPLDEAYARVAPLLAAIPDEELVRPNVDVPAAVTILMERLPMLLSLRAEWLEKLPSVDIANLDRLQVLAPALAHTHSAMAVVGEAASELPESYERALERRDALLATAKSLAAFGLLDASQFERVSLDRGYRNVAYDLRSLVALYQAEWSRIGHRCPFDLADVQASGALANEMFYGSTERTRVPGPMAPSVKERQRAYTALIRAYDEVRRAVTFLRWHEGDANVYAPGLVPGGRGGARRGTDRGEDTETPTVAAGTAPASTGALTSARSTLTAPLSTAPRTTSLDDDEGKDSLFVGPDAL